MRRGSGKGADSVASRIWSANGSIEARIRKKWQGSASATGMVLFVIQRRNVQGRRIVSALRSRGSRKRMTEMDKGTRTTSGRKHGIETGTEAVGTNLLVTSGDDVESAATSITMIGGAEIEVAVLDLTAGTAIGTGDMRINGASGAGAEIGIEVKRRGIGVVSGIEGTIGDLSGGGEIEVL